MAFTPRTREEAESYRPNEVLECTIERVTYHNEENGYAVLKVLPMDARDKVKADVIPVLGSFSNPVVGESLRIFGWWDKHPQHGKQFKALRYEVIRPATAAAIEKYLGSGMIKGIGPKAAEWMVKKFGVKTLEVIEHHPDKLQEVKGIGEKKALMIQAGFVAQKEIAAIMEFLIGHGITPTYAVKIYKYYKERAIEQVEKNPYQLATDIWGIGFRSADKIALNLGVVYDAPQRLEAGLVYVLNSEMESGGHCYLPQNELVSKAAENLYIKSADDLPEHDQAHEKAQLGQKLDPVLADLIQRGLLVAETVELMGHEEVAIYTPSFHTTEKAVADRVHQLLNSPWRNRPKPAEIDKILDSLPGHETLSEEQDMAVRRALSESVLVLTGGPGCGKCVVGDTLVLGTNGFTTMRSHWGENLPDVPDGFHEHKAQVVTKDGIATTSHAYCGGVRETRRVKTHLGLELEGTPNHRLWTMTETGPDWKRLDELKPGDRVAVRRGDNIWGNEAFSSEAAYWLGQQTKDSTEPVPELLAVKGGSAYQQLKEGIAALHATDEKQVPARILRASRQVVEAFLAGFFEVSVFQKPQLAFRATIAGAQLTQAIQLLLLNLGIVAARTEVSGKWRITIEGEEAERMWSALPFRFRFPREEVQIASLTDCYLWDKVESTEESEAPVYDLTVPGPHSFIANGLVNHNTFTTNFIVQALEKLGRRIQIAAPTGRAAKRAAEVSGREAKTIHRLLVFDPEKKGFKHGPGEPLELDVLVIDESSMLDLMLTHNTIRAIPDGAQIIFVGDVDQLPSVGAGNVLSDLIQSGRVPVARLTQVFRQAATSKIITNAHAINKGKMPTLLPPSEAKNGADCVFIEVDETEDLLQKIKGIVAKSLPNLGFKPEEITVLSPMQRGMVGVRNLNEELQKIVNPPHVNKNEHPRGGIILRVGDRVMQRRNNYDKNVFNGDVGYIGSIDSEEQMLIVDYPEGPVEYEFAETDELNHAFSLTTHKCLHPDERIRTQRGLIPISEVQAGDQVQTGFGQKRRVLECFKTGDRSVVVLKTRSGQTLKVSPEHPLWTIPSGQSNALWRTAGELEVGDILALDRTVWESVKEPELPEVVPLVGRPNAELPCVPSRMNPQLAYLLGLIVGDGSYRDQKDGTIDLTSMDAEIQEAYEKTLTSFGLRVCRYAPKGSRAIRLYIVSRAFRAWLLELGLHYASARAKRIPEIIFRASTASRAAFLRGLFDTDGSAGKEGSSNRSVRLVTASSKLADDVQQLLLSLGIVSNRRHSAVAVMLEVSGPSLPVFAERIGFGLNYKKERLEKLITSQGEVGKTNRDTIPFGPSLAEDLWGVLKKRNCPAVIRLRSILSHIRHNTLQMSYRHLAECVAYLEREGLPILPRACQALRLHHYFDSLVSVEKTSETAAMIDIEVEGIHSFVAGSGMICHNSQGSEYPACVIIVHNTHYMMLQRNLVYTALTRAKKFAVIIGTQWALKRSVSNKHVQPRYTRLAQRLQNLVEGIGTSGLPGAAKTGRDTRELPTPPIPGRLF
ncbi:helix-hairpin-helix domain-containing protein [Armatimonas sp.]|uniref:helix-hairpin-helix domain-containing protein n=1 Tax=Armatimonas sp. TaxID=1872638 RepID=UPI00286AD778|nr:helix-hairpin-helix domain-containing protein [Armatimonas sp.]